MARVDEYEAHRIRGEVWHWRLAVQLQEKRVSRYTADGLILAAEQQVIDIYFFALALGQLHRACERANGLGISKAGEALAVFNREQPQATAVRHFLEHADAYQAGKGRMHQDDTLDPGVRKVQWYEYDGADSEVVITQDLTLRVGEAARAADTMAQAVLIALHASIA